MNSENHHYIPQFYLRMFSCNPKASKSRQEIYCLTMKGKNISKERIKDVCSYPVFNTEAQENRLSAIESELAPPLRDLVESQTFTDNSRYVARTLTSLLIAGSLRFRAVYSQMEDELIQLGDDFEKYFTREYRIQGRLDYTLLCAKKIRKELEDNYQTMFLLTANYNSFITSDSPVVFHAKEDRREDYIIDFTDIEPILFLDENTKELFFRGLSYKIERIRISASVLYVPLSSKTLLMLIDTKKLHYGVAPDRLMISEDEINRFNKHIFGRCNSYAFASSEYLLQHCKGIVRPDEGGIISTYTYP